MDCDPRLFAKNLIGFKIPGELVFFREIYDKKATSGPYRKLVKRSHGTLHFEKLTPYFDVVYNLIPFDPLCRQPWCQITTKISPLDSY